MPLDPTPRKTMYLDIGTHRSFFKNLQKSKQLCSRLINWRGNPFSII